MALQTVKIVDIGGSGIRAAKIGIADGIPIERINLHECAIPSIPLNGAFYSELEIQELYNSILEAANSFDNSSDNSDVHFLATAGFRSSTNYRRITDRLLKQNINVTIVSKDDEARYIGSAACTFIAATYPELKKDTVLVAKTGGGSTEEIIYSDDNCKSISFPIGVIPLKRELDRSKPRISNVVEIITTLTEQTIDLADGYKIDTTIFCGRMMKRIAKALVYAISKNKRISIDEDRLTVDLVSIQQLIDALEENNSNRIFKDYGIKASSKTRYLAAALSMKAVLNASRSNHALVSPYAMREGFAIDVVKASYGADELLISN